MDKINLKDILNGKLTKLPFDLNITESYEFILALADALGAMRREQFPDATTASDIKIPDEFAVITDNFIQFVMNEDNTFTIETILAAFIRAIRIHQVPFDSETDAFILFYKKYSGWIIGGQTEGKGVYVGNGQWDKEWKPAQPKNLVAGSGGHFTLRDHNMPKKNQ